MQVKRCRDWFVFPQSQNQQYILRHAFAQLHKEFQIEVWHGAVIVVSLVITVDKKTPVLIADVVPGQPLETDTRSMNFTPLLPDFLALAVAHSTQEVLEILVLPFHPVFPVKLNALAQGHPCRFHFPRFMLLWKKTMKR